MQKDSRNCAIIEYFIPQAHRNLSFELWLFEGNKESQFNTHNFVQTKHVSLNKNSQLSFKIILKGYIQNLNLEYWENEPEKLL